MSTRPPAHARRNLVGGVGAAVSMLAAGAASAPAAAEFPAPEIAQAPRSYLCRRTTDAIVVDGRLTDDGWGRAPWTADFVDIRGDAYAAPRHRTRAKLLWDDEHLYVAAVMEEPHVWATLTERDAVIFHDNDFEVFIDPDGDTHAYYELEVNALGTEWDLLIVKPYRDGGPAVHAWDIAGLASAVHVDGTLNDPTDVDEGWSIEIAFPWAILRECAGRSSPPTAGDQWRLNFSRVQWRLDVAGGGYRKQVDPESGDPLPEDNWVWSPQGLVNMHYPEMWGIVEFAPPGAPPDATAAPDPHAAVRAALSRVYYAQRTFRSREGHWAGDVDALGLSAPPVPGVPWPPALTATPLGFECRLEIPGGAATILEDGRLWTEPDR